MSESTPALLAWAKQTFDTITADHESKFNGRSITFRTPAEAGIAHTALSEAKPATILLRRDGTTVHISLTDGGRMALIEGRMTELRAERTSCDPRIPRFKEIGRELEELDPILQRLKNKLDLGLRVVSSNPEPTTGRPQAPSEPSEPEGRPTQEVWNAWCHAAHIYETQGYSDEYRAAIQKFGGLTDAQFEELKKKRNEARKQHNPGEFERLDKALEQLRRLEFAPDGTPRAAAYEAQKAFGPLIPQIKGETK